MSVNLSLCKSVCESVLVCLLLSFLVSLNIFDCLSFEKACLCFASHFIEESSCFVFTGADHFEHDVLVLSCFYKATRFAVKSNYGNQQRSYASSHKLPLALRRL